MFLVQLMIVIRSRTNYSRRLYGPSLASVAAKVAFSLGVSKQCCVDKIARLTRLPIEKTV